MNRDVRLFSIRGGHAASLESTESVRRHFAKLSARERQVMLLIASGLVNKQVARELGISVPTVKFHRSAVMRKMEAGSLAALVWMAASLDSPGAQLRFIRRASDPLADLK